MEWRYCLETSNNHLKRKGLWEKKFSREDELMSCILSDSKTRTYIRGWLNLNDREAKEAIEKKSLEQAQSFNKAGHNEFKNKKYAASIRSYTKSAFHAPKDSCDLPKAIANRSAALFYLNRYDDCIKDIDLALSWGYPAELSYKLYLRKARSYIKLHGVNGTETLVPKLQEILDTYDKITNSTNDELKATGQLLKECFLSEDNTGSVSDTLPDLRPKVAFGTNSEFPYASSGISRAYSQEKGNHVVTNRKIEAGQILFVEKPVACIPLMDYARKDICNNCCRSCRDVPVPCTVCLDVMYCTIECFNEALSSHHSWECPGYQIGIWKEVGIAALTLRTLLNSTTITDTSRCNEMNNLMTNMERLSSPDLVAYGITAAMLTTYLANYTDYFEVHDLEKCLLTKFSNDTCNFSKILTISKDKELYVGSLLLRYCLQLICNGHSIGKIQMGQPMANIVYQGKVKIVASGFYPSASIMNHSCKPNILNIFANQYLIVRAAEDIAEGDEVLNCYGPHYRYMTTKERQEALAEQYRFVCKCVACTQPKYGNFLEKYVAQCCPKCKNILYTVNDHSCQKKCKNCSFTTSPEYEMTLVELSKLSSLANTLFQWEKYFEALKVTEKLLIIRKGVLYKYHDDIHSTLNMMGEIYITMGQLLEAISCQEQVLLCSISKLGPMQLDIAQEQSDIVYLCLKYLKTDSGTSAKYRETVAKIRMYLPKIQDIVRFNCGTWSDEYRYAVQESKKIWDTLPQDCS